MQRKILEEENKQEEVAAGPKDEAKYQEVGEEKVEEDKPSNKAFIPYKNAFKKVKDIKKYFLFERELGRGAFGEVYLAIH
jgi:hypothetical protein